ncbi:Uncharacterized protein APZ42_024987 [Daphnia magna]|uniref:Uncharacterized protein n=1 Tax=Daphnia magna TaxID=35525 RepID=A0A164TK73_9CRUS|nr:Uncharacterized protein APZ42_024987 [Daphnia magna]
MKIVHIQKTISLTRFLPRRVQQKKRNVDLNSHDWVSCHRSLCCFLTPFCTILSLDYFSLSLSLSSPSISSYPRIPSFVSSFSFLFRLPYERLIKKNI